MARTRTKWSFSKIAAGAALGVLLSSGICRADGEPSPADVESAKVAFTEGMAAREKNDHDGALVKFRAAYALVPTPITGLEVGKELIETGKILEGRALLLEVSRMPKKPGESDKAQQARDDAADLAEKARPKLATLTVETDATEVTIDGVAIPKDATRAPRVLDPGHHVVIVHAPNKSGRAEVDLAPGDQHQIHVDAAHDDTPPKPIAPPKSHLVFKPGTPFFASVVVTGAGLLIGIGTGIPAVAIAGHLASECPSKKCPSSAKSDLDTTLALGWVSTISFAVAGAGAIATIITAALSTHRETPPPPPQTTSVRLVPALGGFLVEGTF